MKARFVFVDPPAPPGFVSFKHSHAGYGEFCKASRLRLPTLDLFHNASLLLDHGHPAEIVDSALEGHTPEQSASAIALRKPDWIVYRTASASLDHDLRCAGIARRFSGAGIIFYGPWLAQESETPLKSNAVAAVVLGESAPIFLEIARRGALDGVSGVHHKKAGRIIREAAAPAANLDCLPIPRWDLVDYRRYSYVTTQTSWGCPFACGYCPYPLSQGSAWRARRIPSVVAEFTALRERYGLRFVQLRDPEFTLNRRRTEALCQALIAAGTPITWGCETRLDTLDEPLEGLMAEAGCLSVHFGVESINPRSLKAMGRSTLDPAEIKRRVERLKKHGLLTYALYMIGLPGETRQSTRRLIDFALDLGTDGASFSMATPFPGTALEKQARSRGWLEAENILRLTSSVPSMRNADMKAVEIEELYLEAKRRWKQRARRESSPLTSRV